MGRKNRNDPGKSLNKKELSNNILTVFSAHPKKLFNYKQLSAILLITDKAEKRLITEVLYELRDRETLEEVTSGRFRLRSQGGYVIGTVEMARGGYGYIATETIKEDIFVSQNNLNRALDGDTVKVLIYAHKKSRTLEGEVIEILERARETFVGTIE
jgi:ribonuclease R